MKQKPGGQRKQSEGSATREEVVGAVRGRLRRAAERATRDGMPSGVILRDGAKESREAGFVGDVAATGPGVRLADPLATLAGWSWGEVLAAAGIKQGWGGGAELQRSAASRVWWEAKARVALRGFLQSVGGEIFHGVLHDGGEAALVDLPPSKLAEAIEAEGTKLIAEETRNWLAQMPGAIRENAAAARGAERAALRTEATVKGRAKTDTLDADLVEAFKAFDAARKEEAGTQAEIAAGVIADAEEEGRMICCGTRKFLEWWRGWVKVGRPDAERYAAMHRERKRRPV